MKKILGVSLLVLLFGLSTFSIAQSQVESGSWGVSTATTNYTFNKNEGDRIMTINVSFDTPFDVKPDVVLSVTMLDASDQTAVRYDVSAMSISRDGFSIRVKTWSNTQIKGISGTWLAHAPASME